MNFKVGNSQRILEFSDTLETSSYLSINSILVVVVQTLSQV